MQISILTSYPKHGQTHGENIVGVASYTKKTVDEILRHKTGKRLRFTIYAEQLQGEPDTTEDPNVTVERTWKRNSVKSLVKTIRLIAKNKSKVLIAPIEVYMYGTTTHLGFFLLGLAYLRARGKKIIIIAHQAPTDFASLTSKKAGLLFHLLSPIYFRVLKTVAHTIVVFETALKTAFGKSKKVVVIPHGVEINSFSPKVPNLPKTPNPKVPNALLFGFIAPYKGIDTILDLVPLAQKSQKPLINLTIAGGPNPNHLVKPDMRAYMKMIEHKAAQKKATITGFVPESKIADYFTQADVVLFPYRTFMSSSGPLALAFSYRKPVLVSEALLPYFETPDFQWALSKAKLTKSDFLIPKTSEEFVKKLTELKSQQSRYIAFAEHIAHARRWSHVAQKYTRMIEACSGK